jgi:phosphatidate cytidylyltransferase
VTQLRPISPARPPLVRSTTYSTDWITRPLFGVLLAALVIAADFYGPISFATLIAVCAILAAREWHRLVAQDSFLPEMLISALAVMLSLGCFLLRPHSWAAPAILVFAAGLAFVAAFTARGHPLWQSGGVLYIGVPALALVATRALAPYGAWLIVGLFLAVWATDTGALVAGKLIGGPKLAPVLSPNKTWAGTLGGIASAAVVEAVFVGVIGGRAVPAFFYGAALSVVAHGGDLFESWVKRRFSRKDSGSLIPGHGGALDRIDSTLAAAIAFALLALVFKFDLLFGAQP